MLSQLSQFFPLCPLHPAPPPFSGNPYDCSCPWIMRVSSLTTPFPTLYFISSWLSVTTYLYFLVLSPFHPFPTIRMEKSLLMA